MAQAQPRVASENRLLAALPADAYRQLLPRLEPVTLQLRQVIESPGDPVRHAYFPRTGLLSLVVVLADGAGVEVAMVGQEGMLGLPLLLEPPVAPTQVVCQLPCEVVRLGASAFREMVERSAAFSRLLHRYASIRYGEVIQTVACHAHHSTVQRLARWLLLTHDRMQADQFPLTHELLAHMATCAARRSRWPPTRCNRSGSSATTGDRSRS